MTEHRWKAVGVLQTHPFQKVVVVERNKHSNEYRIRPIESSIVSS